MSRPSPTVTVMMDAARAAGRRLIRDFGEVENLQVSRKGPSDFVSNADKKAEEIIRKSLEKTRPGYGFLLEEGNEIGSIDKAMVDFGMPMGPLRLLDEIGLDVADKVSHVLGAAFGDRVEPAGVLEAMVQGGRTGRKGGLGFYRYRDGGATPDPAVYPLADRPSRDVITAGPEAWRERMLLAMVDEAARCLEENVVESPAQVDLAMIMDYWSDQAINHHTEATSMLYAARECGRILLKEGLQKAFARHALASKALTAGLEAMGLRLFGDQKHKMANVTGVYIPQGVDGSVAELRGK